MHNRNYMLPRQWHPYHLAVHFPDLPPPSAHVCGSRPLHLWVHNVKNIKESSLTTNRLFSFLNSREIHLRLNHDHVNLITGQTDLSFSLTQRATYEGLKYCQKHWIQTSYSAMHLATIYLQMFPQNLAQKLQKKFCFVMTMPPYL